MQLSSRSNSCTCTKPSRSQLCVQAIASRYTYLPATPAALDRPGGGASRSAELPRSSDFTLSNWGPSSDIQRPSNGAARGVVFAAASDRPGGRGRADMPAGWDLPTPSDPALARPGGRGGRDLDLAGSDNPGTLIDLALARPGGRGGRDVDLSSSDSIATTPIIDRPGGRGGRESMGGGGNCGDGGSSGGSGGSDGNDSGGSSGDGEWNAGSIFTGVVMYIGVLAACWVGHHKYILKKAPAAEEPEKSCYGGKGAKTNRAAAGKRK